MVGSQDSKQGASQYQFDPLDQLSLSKHPTGEETFSFDSFGNPEGEDTEVSDDRLLSFQGNRYSYDTFGNQVRMQSPAGYQQRQYNGLNQLTSVKNGGRYTQYQYDAFGRRSAKITEGGQTDYLWDGEHLIGEHCNGEYTWYLYEPGTFKPVALIKQGQIYHYHLDHLGTPLKLTDQSGAVVWDAQYQTLGAVTLNVEAISNPLRFQGQYFDEETGLHYNRFRYYDPDSGRFIHQDPIGLLGGLNHYQYAPNPVQWIDPLGLSCKEGDHNDGIKLPSGRFLYPLENIVTAQPVDRGLLLNSANWTVENVPLVGDVIEGIGNQIGYYSSGLRDDGLKINPFTGNQLSPLDEQSAVFETITAGLGSVTGKFATGFAKNVVPEGLNQVKSSAVVRELVDSVDEVVPNNLSPYRTTVDAEIGSIQNLGSRQRTRYEIDTALPGERSLTKADYKAMMALEGQSVRLNQVLGDTINNQEYVYRYTTLDTVKKYYMPSANNPNGGILRESFMTTDYLGLDQRSVMSQAQVLDAWGHHLKYY